jgi:hypothetical protein
MGYCMLHNLKRSRVPSNKIKAEHLAVLNDLKGLSSEN